MIFVLHLHEACVHKVLIFIMLNLGRFPFDGNHDFLVMLLNGNVFCKKRAEIQ